MNKVYNPLPILFIFLLSINLIFAINNKNIFSSFRYIVGLVFFISLALEDTKLNKDRKLSKLGFASSLIFVFLYFCVQ